MQKVNFILLIVNYPVFCIIAARYDVFIPGAAHISKTVLSTSGFNKYAAKQLAYKQNIQIKHIKHSL